MQTKNIHCLLLEAAVFPNRIFFLLEECANNKVLKQVYYRKADHVYFPELFAGHLYLVEIRIQIGLPYA